jgi:hypothetical protein
MARIYQPLPRQSDGRFDMTVSSDDERWTHPIGYCAGSFDNLWPEQPRESHIQAWMSAEMYQADRARHLPFRDHYHADGHATSAEASACYAKYRIDHERRSFEEKDTQRKCVACQAWTTHRVMVGDHTLLVLCEADDTREEIEKQIAAK